MLHWIIKVVYAEMCGNYYFLCIYLCNFGHLYLLLFGYFGYSIDKFENWMSAYLFFDLNHVLLVAGQFEQILTSNGCNKIFNLVNSRPNLKKFDKYIQGRFQHLLNRVKSMIFRNLKSHLAYQYIKIYLKKAK